MRISAHVAANELFSTIRAPIGAVNTIVQKMPKSERIRVLVEPSYFYRIQPLPKTYKGYAVIVEKRQPATACV